MVLIQLDKQDTSEAQVFFPTIIFDPPCTHSARQARYMQLLFSLIQSKGSDGVRDTYQYCSYEERLNLILGAYFLRAGRVDESSHKNPPADDYNTRSACILLV